MKLRNLALAFVFVVAVFFVKPQEAEAGVYISISPYGAHISFGRVYYGHRHYYRPYRKRYYGYYPRYRYKKRHYKRYKRQKYAGYHHRRYKRYRDPDRYEWRYNRYRKHRHKRYKRYRHRHRHW